MSDRREVEKALDAIYDYVNNLFDENDEFDAEIYDLNETLDAKDDYIDSLKEQIKEMEKDMK